MATATKKTIDLKEKQGFLHQSREKTSEGAPDYFGSFKKNGITFSIGGWKKDAEKSDDGYISLNLENLSLSEDERKAEREKFLKEFKAERKKQKDKKIWITGQLTGSFHRQPDVNKKEDFFGKVNIYGDIVNLHCFANEKDGKPYLLIKENEGIKSKDERTKIAEGF